MDEGVNVDAGVRYKAPTDSYVSPEMADKEWASFFQGHPQLIGLSGDPDMEALDAYYQKALEDFELPGMSVVIVKDGKVLFSKGYGHGDVANGKATRDHGVHDPH